MKIAIIHDSLIEFGGSERVLTTLLDMFPGASLFTAYYDPAFCRRAFPGLSSHPLYASFLQRFPVSRHTSLVQSMAPLVWGSFDLSGYGLVISNADHLMNSFVRVGNGVHIAYVHSLPKNIFGLESKTPLQRIYPYGAYIRPLYASHLKSIHNILANSKHSQRLLRRLLGLSSTVIYPPVGLPGRTPDKSKPGKYYLVVSRLDPTKRLETAILAANRIGVPLLIAGTGITPWYERRLRDIAGPTVAFAGHVPDSQMRELYASAIAFVFTPRNEDFGITPLEATAHGIPVIAYYGGGAKETVVEGKTGTFFRTYSADAVAGAMQRIRHMKFSPSYMYAHAQKFSEERFKNEILACVRHAFSSGVPPTQTGRITRR